MWSRIGPYPVVLLHYVGHDPMLKIFFSILGHRGTLVHEQFKAKKAVSLIAFYSLSTKALMYCMSVMKVLVAECNFTIMTIHTFAISGRIHGAHNERFILQIYFEASCKNCIA